MDQNNEEVGLVLYSVLPENTALVPEKLKSDPEGLRFINLLNEFEIEVSFADISLNSIFCSTDVYYGLIELIGESE